MSYELVIPFLTFLGVVSIGGAVIAAHAASRERVRTRIGELQPGKPLSPGAPRSPLLRLVSRLGSATSGGRASDRLKAELVRAGYHGSSAMMIYMGSKFLLLCAGSLVSAVLLLPIDKLTMPVKVLIVCSVGFFLFLLPNLVVHVRRQRRCDEVRTRLAEALDLLEICVSAGMGLDLAWNSVAEEIRGVSRVLADEMALTNFEMHLNAPRTDAMRHMAERTGADELSALVAVLVQSDRFGTSVGEALRTFANSMRETRSQKAEESAERMTVKLLFPMITLIFPAVFVVICGPAVIRWIQFFGGW